jgi:hypothetical protein
MSAVSDYRFTPSELRAGGRSAGISAFMRIRNGADFLEATIRSHLPFVDEVVAVHNQCTDASPEILARLAVEFGQDRIRVFDYLPRVHPPGSIAHAAEPASSPHSFVAMSNFALAQTRHRVAMKLDDDHLAMAQRFAAIVEKIRAANYRLDAVVCFSGINLARDENGRCGVSAAEPLAGAGDHFLFEVSETTHFIHDRRFEDFDRGGKPRRFADIAYWHLKYLKPDLGFGNRDLLAGGNPRFARKRAEIAANRRVMTLAELADRAPRIALPGWMVPEKARLTADRWRRLRAEPPRETEMRAACALASVGATA